MSPDWAALRTADCAVPEDISLTDAAAELINLLGDTDPAVRDDTAYVLLATWVRRGTYDDLLPGLGDGLSVGLRHGLGEDGTDTVLRRSFSALLLAAAIERDNTARLLHPSVVMRWADVGLDWFLTEHDLRGHLGAKGWAHAAASGADLVAALGRSRHLSRDELAVLMEAVADRLARSAPHVLLHGEDDRLAYATMAIVQRNELEAAWLADWVRRLVKPFALDPAGPHAAAHVNTLNYTRALHLALLFGIAGAPPWHGDEEYFRSEPAARRDLLRLVGKALRDYHPGLYREPRRSDANGDGSSA
jgi:hypothetical protein